MAATPVTVDIEENSQFDISKPFWLRTQTAERSVFMNLQFLIQNEQGLAKAANQAYRDAGAKLILEFESHPEIKQWLTSKGF